MEFVVRVRGITGEYSDNSQSYLNRRILFQYFVFSLVITVVVALLITAVVYDNQVIVASF